MLAQVKSGLLMGGKRTLGTIGFVGAVAEADDAVPMPGGIAAGDLAVYFDLCIKSGGVPANVTPSGFIAIGTSQTSNNAGIGIRWNQFYKVLNGSETSVAGMTDGILLGKSVAVFRITGGGAWGSPGSVGQEVGQYSGAMASDKIVTAGAAPLVMIGCTFGGDSSGLVMSPAATAELTLDVGGNGFLTAGYVIHNTSPSSNTVSTNDAASQLAVAGFYLPIV